MKLLNDEEIYNIALEGIDNKVSEIVHLCQAQLASCEAEAKAERERIVEYGDETCTDNS